MRTNSLLLAIALSSDLLAFGPTGFMHASAPSANPTGTVGAAPTGFEENKGQVRTTDGTAAPFVRYRLSQGNTQLFLLENGIAYQFSRVHYPAGYQELVADGHLDPEQQEQLDALREQVRLETFRMNMILEGANPAAHITTEGRSNDYTQYYNHDALDVHTYTKVTYHEVYPGVDWVVYTTEKGMKYDFVVRPDADPEMIRLRFEHHEELSVDANGNLIHGNRMGRFTEERPVSFQDGKEVATSFVLEGNTLRFALGKYDPSQPLTIDPARIWGTYYGGAVADEGRACTTDAAGNVYLAGVSFSSTGLAASGHQNTAGGGWDAFLVKFDSDGQRLWATYYGGTAHEFVGGCTTDANGNIFLTGSTLSSAMIASGGHQETFAGGNDAFLVKFNGTGVRLWATYYGGSGNDLGRSCVTDINGDIYVSGETSSGTGIASAGHQNTLGGAIDAFLVKFSSDGQRLWGTYYGGAFSDPGTACAADALGNIYLSGSTGSYSAIASPAAYQPVHAGEVPGFQEGTTTDAFLVKFNAVGVRQWGTYYGGIQEEFGGSCSVDGGGNAYLAATTSSEEDIASAGHQNTYGGGAYDAFLVKFNSAGQRQWATYYGGALLDDGTSCAVDGNDHVFLAGTTLSLSGIAEGGHQNALTGAQNAFLASFDEDGVRQWGTYYGGAGYHTGEGCAVDPDDNVYLAGITASASGIADGGHQNTFGGDHDAFLVKFEGSMPTPDCSTTADLLESEPNSTILTANALPYNTVISGSLGNCAPADNTADYFGIVTTAQGVLRIDACLSNTGPVPLNVTFHVRLNTSILATFTLVAGANDEAITGSFELPCHGIGAFTISITNPSTTYCTNYAFSYSTLFPVFGSDPEPNNGGSQATPVAYDTFQEGQIAFAGDNLDYYVITPTLQGTMHIEIQAEHASASPGSMDVTLAYSGIPIIVETIPVGANGQPITTTVSIPCRGSSSNLLVFFDEASACGTYRWRYYTTTPYFQNDTEPNNTVAASILLPEDTYASGQMRFHSGVDGTGADNSDVYRADLPADGVLNVTIEAEHTGASDTETIQVQVRNSGGVTLATWNGSIGANATPALSTFSLPCRGATIPYYLWLSASACGTSYRVSWNVTPAYYANDAEPNNASATAVLTELSTNWYDGHIGFYNTTDDDYFRFTHPGGPFAVTLSAEHAAPGDGTMNMVVMTTTGTIHGTFIVPVGGASTPLTNTFSIASLAAGSLYILRFSDVTCGVSYRIHCHDTDGDGTCNGSDLCAGGPEPGTPCDDGDSGTINDVITAGCVCAGTPSNVAVALHVFLEGPYDADAGLMNDALRDLAAFPLTDPYPALGYTHTGGGNNGTIIPAVLTVNGADAIVDWVLVELRSSMAPATVLASRSALVQRDGDIVEPDGSTPISFAMAPGMYYVAIRHRNHLGTMTKDPVNVSTGMALLDLTDPLTETYGSQARASISGSFPAEVLWSGDTSFDGELKYVGQDNDRDPILVEIGGSVPTNTLANAYSVNDCNLDGIVKYVGQDNDRDPILVNIGGSVPTNTRQEQLP